MNDTKGCADSIEFIVATLVLMYFEVIQLVKTILFPVLQNACHRIKRGYDVSACINGNATVLIATIR